MVLHAVLCYKKTNQRISTFSIQSYWGDLNRSLNVLADTIFVLDEFARKITLEKCHTCKVIISGPLQEKRYKEIDVVRNRMTLTKKNKVIGFFGQPLFGYHWYKITIITFLEKLLELDFQFEILYKPHPNETSESVSWTKNEIAKRNIDLVFSPRSDVLNDISITDLTVSLFSTVGYDLQNILARSPIPFSTPLYLLYEEGCQKWREKYVGLTMMPMSDNGMALVVDQSSELCNKILLGLDPKFQRDCHHILKEKLNPRSKHSANIVLDGLLLKI